MGRRGTMDSNRDYKKMSKEELQEYTDLLEEYHRELQETIDKYESKLQHEHEKRITKEFQVSNDRLNRIREQHQKNIDTNF